MQVVKIRHEMKLNEIGCHIHFLQCLNVSQLCQLVFTAYIA
jgi:hypothetical protein